MGCSQFGKKKPEGEDAVAVGANGELANGDAGKGKSDKGNKKSKKSKGAKDGEANGEAKNGKTGPNSAKVRPLTPTPTNPQNLPKPVAFDVTLDSAATAGQGAPDNGGGGGGKAGDGTEAGGNGSAAVANSGGGAVDSAQLTSEELMEKQRRAEEKRLGILEEKKLKARKFVEKFGNNGSQGKSTSLSSSQDEDDSLVMNGTGMNGLDSGLGLDGYGIDPDEKQHTDAELDEVEQSYRAAAAGQPTAGQSVASVVVQDGSAARK